MTDQLIGLAKNLQEDVRSVQTGNISEMHCSSGGWGGGVSRGSVSSLELADGEVIALSYPPRRLIVNSASFHTHFVYSAYRQLSGPTAPPRSERPVSSGVYGACSQSLQYVSSSLWLGVCEAFVSSTCLCGFYVLFFWSSRDSCSVAFPTPKPTSHLNTSAVCCKTFPSCEPTHSPKNNISTHQCVCVCICLCPLQGQLSSELFNVMNLIPRSQTGLLFNGTL